MLRYIILGTLALLPANCLFFSFPYCRNAARAYEDLFNGFIYPGLSTSRTIFSSLRTPQKNSLCDIEKTCCSPTAEAVFQLFAVNNKKSRIANQVKSSGLLSCSNHPIFSETANYVRQSKEQLLQDLRLAYGNYLQNIEVFDEFYDYLANSVHTGDVSDLSTEFTKMFLEVYLLIFLSHPDTPPSITSSVEFRDCFFSTIFEMRGRQIQNWLVGFLRSYNKTLHYFRALRVVDRVVEAVLQLKLSSECRRSLLQITHCSQCAGYARNIQTCGGLCLNTLRGCLVDLSDLLKPTQDFSQALIAMKKQVTSFDFYTQVTLLSTNIFVVLQDATQNFRDILEAVQQCPLGQRGSRVVRRQGGANNNGARVHVERPLHTLNSSAFCLLEHTSLFSELPEALCKGMDVSRSNRKCWNGRTLGGYSRDVVGFTRSQQADNPEVQVCTSHRQFLPLLQLLRFMTKELNSLTGVCSEDDEDCLRVTPITRYYDLDAIDLTSIVISTGSGYSGSGMEISGDDEFDDSVESGTSTCDPKSIPY